MHLLLLVAIHVAAGLTGGVKCVHLAPPGEAKARVLLIHGTFHDSRCFEEFWLPELAAQGFDAWAVSLRSPGGKVTMTQHADDVAELLRRERGRWFVAGHSFGGPVAMEVARREPESVRGIACLCSVPPSGNVAMTWRTVKRSLREAWLITRAFALKTAAKNLDDARELFFHKSNVSDDALAKYVAIFAENSKTSLDLRHFTKNLPSRFADAKSGGKATFLRDGRRKSKNLVVGAANDLIVDDVALRETAAFLDCEPAVVLPDTPHDLMLDPDQWRRGLEVLTAWLRKSAATSDDDEEESSSL